MQLKSWTALVVAAALLGCGCSDTGNPVEPSSPQQTPPTANQSVTPTQPNRYLWGLWDVSIDPESLTAEITPQRIAEMHLNTVRLLEVMPCTNCLRIENVALHSPSELSADFVLRHPFPGLLKFTGFDVRGIFISGSDYLFPATGRTIAVGDNLPRLLNADGYTALFNPTEFPEDSPTFPALKYTTGHHATGGDLTATLNPFVAYCSDEPRRMFAAGSGETRTVLLHWPGWPIEFGYAVDACWQLVDGEVTDPVEDFPPDANCLEAYQIDVQVSDGTGTEVGRWALAWGGGTHDSGYAVAVSKGESPVRVEVFDHQGLETIAGVFVEAPDAFAGEKPLSFSTVTGEESYLFTGTFMNELGADECQMLARVVDTETDQNLGPVDAWQVREVELAGVSRGEFIYVTGQFQGTVDFDPGSGVEEQTAVSGENAFLSKFDPGGEFQWVRTWGDAPDPSLWGQAKGRGVAVDGLGNVYVTGDFTDTVDFDPGPPVDEHTAIDHEDAFLIKFDSNGGFQWARTWGGPDDPLDLFGDAGRAVTVDESGGVYVAGHYSGTDDFDPGAGVDEHTSNDREDVFLSKFDTDGQFQWARTWGGLNNDGALGCAADGFGSIYVAGWFLGPVDFDPGPDTDEQGTLAGWDAFLSKFDSSGDFQWARTWGGIDIDGAGAVAVDGFGNAYVTGWWQFTVDFDPGPEVEEYTSLGNVFTDVNLSKFSPDGEFQWVRTWGGYLDDFPNAINVDEFGNILVAGEFRSTADFDPGPGTDERKSAGEQDVFVSKFDSSGGYLWAHAWGAEDPDTGFGVASDGSGNVYVTGEYMGTVDFDPGVGVDEISSKGYQDAFLTKIMPDG